MIRLLAMSLLFATACHKEAPPPTPNSQESGQLNEAEDMLNALAENEEGPAPEGASPSNSSD